MFFSLSNLCSSAVSECPTPWTFTAAIPHEVKGKEGKKARDKWINDPTTLHQCYSAFEGFNPSQRISEPKAVGEEGNPPLRLHAFVADFDTTITQEELVAGIGRVSLKPNYYEKTLSGNARLVWLFERPVSFPNRKFAVEFMKFALARSRFENVAAALDKPAWEEPNRLWTNSCEWWTIDAEARIPHELLQGWVVEVAEKHLWKKDRGAIDIPLPVVWTELQKKYATANQWTGDFVEGAQGPSFWIEGSSSPKSSIVKPTGIFTFSAHAVKPFYSWSDLLGKDFVDRYAAEMLGKAVEGIYFDGKQYYRQDGFGAWKPFSKEDIKDHLATDRGLSTVKDGGLPSEISRAMQYIQNWQGIDGAAPFAFQPPGIIVRHSNRFLNTHTRKVVTPAGGSSVKWGPQGPMPFTSKYLETLWHPDSVPNNPLDYKLAWLHRFYTGCYHRELESGQVLFILGGPGAGKTLWNQGYLPHLVGGAEEAQDYLLGKTDFNSQLFEAALWTVDDNSATVDAATHRKFSAMTKKMAANTVFQYHAKFRVPCSVEWRGRVVVTANSDEASSSIVPDLTISNLEKNGLFRAVDVPAIEFPNRKGCEKLIRDEAPYLARFLLDYQPKDEVVGSSRFGVKAYHEQSLLRLAEQSSRTAGFLELLDDWRRTHFLENSGKSSWEGTSFQLLKEMHKDELNREVGLRNFTAQTINQHLSALKAKGLEWLDAVGTDAGRQWRIARPVAPASAPLPQGSKFSK